MLPEWWQRAQALERENRLEEAEKVIADAVQNQHFALEIADLYRQRWLRLRAENAAEGALEARRKAENWAYFFASQATSGGEGAYLSMVRDDFLKKLGPDR